MSANGDLPSPRAAPRSVALRRVVNQLLEGGPERRAIEAGEIDAVLDYANTNVILFPAARRAIRVVPGSPSPPAPRAAPDAPAANSVLAALTPAEYRELLPGLEPVALRFGEVLHEPGAPIRYVYFPIDCTIGLLSLTQNQRMVESGLVGFEGMVGIALALGVDVSSVRALVQGAGAALRMPAARFQAALRSCPSLQRELYRYAYVKLAQSRQAVACVASHGIEQRLACWILMTSDRSRSSVVALNHDRLSTILGVRRSSVTLASLALRSRRLISARRGETRILNRSGLEAASCACYKRVEAVHAVQRSPGSPRAPGSGY
jgi:CRP-like cAMP-binding protein